MFEPTYDQVKYERNRATVARTLDALNNLTDPGYARGIVQILAGITRKLANSQQDDPLLYAYKLKDVLPEMAQHVINLQKWSHAVIDATPDQITETGAKLCR